MRTALIAALAVGGVFLAGGTKPAAAAEACAPAGKVHYVCGPANAEDLVLAPGTHWVISSGMSGAGSSAGRLYLIDADAKTSKPVTPVIGKARAPYTACPSPLDLSKFAAHGLALQAGKGGRHRLYAVNHGGRESIEMFEVKAGGGEPVVQWIGCVVLPKDVDPNSVAPLPGGGFLVTKFDEAGDAKAFDKMAAGEKTGEVVEWTPRGGFKRLPGTRLDGDNGIVVSPDGKWVFVNEWPNKRVVRFTRGSKAPPVSVSVDFLPDNLRWAPDGKILVAGQASDIKTLIACKETRCPHAWSVVKLDPATMTVTPLLHEEGTQAFSDATGALQVGDDIFVGTYRGDRLAYVKVR